jgi:formylglycine-generating enzyme required for sulfatase activity
VDACRDDPAAGRKVDVDNVPRPPKGTAALFSCASGQRAFETDKLGGKGHGLFFHFVLEGLRGEAKNLDGEVSWDDLTTYVRRQVPRTVVKVIREGAQQSPHLVSNLVNSPVLVPASKERSPRVVKKDKGDTKLEEAKSFTNSIGMKLVLIPEGKFKMGSPADEKGREPVDKGSEYQHEVEITKPFYLGVYTVTQQQYKRVMGENPSWFSAQGGGKRKVEDLDTDDFPVESVSWEDAKKFCDKLSDRAAERRQGRMYRLPTEAEWEYACRGGASSSNPFHFGKSLSTRHANFDGRRYGGRAKGPFLNRTCKVGSYRPNKFGLYDMHGNVFQWCNDWYAKDYYKDSPAKDPQGPDYGTARVVRGGCWHRLGRECRAAYRGRYEPGKRQLSFGFRVVCVSPRRSP